jgi:hypothetical protein
MQCDFLWIWVWAAKNTQILFAKTKSTIECNNSVLYFQVAWIDRRLEPRPPPDKLLADS